MSPNAGFDARDTLLEAWRTNCRATAHLVDHIPAPLWDAPVPGLPQRTIRAIAAHMHNARCSWVRTLGSEHGIVAPNRVDFRRVTRRALVAALKRSERGIGEILELGCSNAGSVPPSKRYVWRNLALDVGHVLTYFVAHEGHHRGQLLLAIRQLDHRLPVKVTGELWQWKRPRS